MISKAKKVEIKEYTILKVIGKKSPRSPFKWRALTPDGEEIELIYWGTNEKRDKITPGMRILVPIKKIVKNQFTGLMEHTIESLEKTVFPEKVIMCRSCFREMNTEETHFYVFHTKKGDKYFCARCFHIFLSIVQELREELVAEIRRADE